MSLPKFQRRYQGDAEPYPREDIKATPSRRPNCILKIRIGNNKTVKQKATRKKNTSHTKNVIVTFLILLLRDQGRTNRPLTSG